MEQEKEKKKSPTRRQPERTSRGGTGNQTSVSSTTGLLGACGARTRSMTAATSSQAVEGEGSPKRQRQDDEHSEQLPAVDLRQTNTKHTSEVVTSASSNDTGFRNTVIDNPGTDDTPNAILPENLEPNLSRPTSTVSSRAAATGSDSGSAASGSGSGSTASGSESAASESDSGSSPGGQHRRSRRRRRTNVRPRPSSKISCTDGASPVKHANGNKNGHN